MNQKQGSFQLSSELLCLLQVVEGTHDQNERTKAILKLGQEKNQNASRILMELWSYLKWRDSKKDIIKALGYTQGKRSVHFLLRIVNNTDDLSMASEAILALGNSGSQLGGEALVSILKSSNHPLRKEAIIALTNMSTFPFSNELSELINSDDLHCPLLQYTIIAICRGVDKENWEKVEKILDQKLEDIPSQVFNAILISSGRLGNAKTIETLRSIDTRYRFFANQLKINGIDRIQSRLRKSVEDVISEMHECKSEEEIIDSALGLKEFPTEEAWEAFQLFGQDFDNNTQCLVRSCLTIKDKVQSDIDFIISEHQTINHQYLVMLLRSLKVNGKSDIIFHLADKLPMERIAHILEDVREVKAIKYIEEKLKSSSISDHIKIIFVNAMVAQAWMWLKESEHFSKIQLVLFQLLKTEENILIKNRITRGLGQLLYNEESFLILLGQQLKENLDDYTSVYSTLVSIGTDEAAKIIIKRVKSISNKKGAEAELKLAIESLAQWEHLPEDFQLQISSVDTLEEPLLLILSICKMSGYEDLILNSILNSNYKRKILGITAAKLNGNSKIWQELMKLLTDENLSIQVRAIDSLCLGADHLFHRKIFDWLKVNPEDKNIILCILTKLSPAKTGSYEGVLSRLNELQKEKNGAFKDKEVEIALLELKNNLVNSNKQRLSKDLSNLPSSDIHNYDKLLNDSLLHFDTYSPKVKTVLRNAELTWQHPELFNEIVDKSTIVIEFTKTVDILLQEKIGSFLFLENENSVISKMQSRVVSLNLEDRSISSKQRTIDLQCSNLFTAENFPHHKLSLLCDSIASGKIVHEQYKVLDGLRAWAIVILIFGRRFKYKDQNIFPIIPLGQTSSKQINEIVFQMNNLQNIRNNAAHRGTVLDLKQIESVRKYSFDLLNELHKILW